MRDNGDDGVLEVRRGTIVKLVASDISTTNSFSLRKACDKLGLCVMMPYIATVRLGGLTKHMVLYRSANQV